MQRRNIMKERRFVMRKIRIEFIEIAFAVSVMIIGLVFLKCTSVDPLEEMRDFHEERISIDYPNENVTLILFENDEPR